MHPATELHAAARAHQILLCLDLTAASESGVPHALSLARTLGGSITLVHVMHPHGNHVGPRSYDALSWEISRQEARSYLDRLAKQLATALGAPVDIRLEQGSPAQRIAELVRELGAEVTVLGGRAKDPAQAGGGIAQQVLALAPGSVLIAHSAGGLAGSTLQRVLVPLDGSRRAEAVLPLAARMALAHHAELLLIHIVQEPRSTALMELSGGLNLALQLASCLQTGARRYLGQLQRQLIQNGIAARMLVMRHANERQCLLQLVQPGQSELVVLSAHGATCDAERSFGGFIAHLMGASTVPMLVLQDLPARDARTVQVPHDAVSARWSHATPSLDLA